MKIFDKIWDNTAFNKYIRKEYKNKSIKEYLEQKRQHFGFNFSILEHIFNGCNYTQYLTNHYAEDIIWIIAFGNYKKECYLEQIEKKNKDLINSCDSKQELQLHEPDTKFIESFFDYNVIYQEPLKNYIKDDRLGEECILSDDSQFEIILEIVHD